MHCLRLECYAMRYSNEVLYAMGFEQKDLHNRGVPVFFKLTDKKPKCTNSVKHGYGEHAYNKSMLSPKLF